MKADYKVFSYTDRMLKKKYSSEDLKNYYNILGFLYQNGYVVNSSNVKEQLEMYNYFKTDEDFEFLKEIVKTWTSDEGAKIVSEEIYNCLKEASFSVPENASANLIKTVYESNLKTIKNIVEDLSNLFNSDDFEIKPVIERYSDVRELLTVIKEKIDKDFKVMAWLKFQELLRVIYSIYTVMNREKNVIPSNSVNNELYGGIGSYNIANKEIKAIIGSAVYDVKKINNISNPSELKISALGIVKDADETDEMKVVKDWLSKGGDFTEVKKILVNYVVSGIINLLMLKYNISLDENDKTNYKKTDLLIDELNEILKFAGVDKNYITCLDFSKF